VPGRRNAAREARRHAALAPGELARIHALLVAWLPDRDRALSTYRTIISEFTRLGIRRRNGRPLSCRMLERWRCTQGLPLLRGATILNQYQWAPPLTTSYALTAWILSRLQGSDRMLFRVDFPLSSRPSRETEPCPLCGRGVQSPPTRASADREIPLETPAATAELVAQARR
jgi:hypothetical protein